MTTMRPGPAATPPRLRLVADDTLGAARASLERHARFGEAEWAGVAALFRPARLCRGQAFSVPGQEPGRVGFLTSGLLRLYHLSADGAEFTKAFFGPGGWVASGPDPALPAAVGLEALEDTRLLVADAVAVAAAVRACHPLAVAWGGLLTEHMARKQRREVELATLPGLSRYARFLAEHRELAARVPKRHVASYLGLTPTQLSRLRRRLGFP